MSVSVDTVYQRVLSILNKEQRGYVTPQEFNLFANQAQMDLFEQYFYDINQFGRMHGNDTEFSDMLNILNEKINIFEVTAAMTYANNHWSAPNDLYRIGTLIYDNKEVERINKNEFLYINASPLTKPSNVRPVFVASSSGYKVYGNAELITGVTCNYIKRPATVAWGYNTVLGEAQYNASNSTNFELHPSEETELVMKILELAGISTRELQVYQIAAQEEMRNTQQEKS
jgi:D-ribose pyranose/furanose isomerase RbsD